MLTTATLLLVPKMLLTIRWRTNLVISRMENFIRHIDLKFWDESFINTLSHNLLSKEERKGALKIGTSVRRCSRGMFRRSSGNDVSGNYFRKFSFSPSPPPVSVIRIGFYQIVRFESVCSRFTSTLTPIQLLYPPTWYPHI